MPSDVDSIRTAELAWFAQSGRYLPAENPVAAAAEPAGNAGARQRPWVEVVDADFRVVGPCDVDGDGAPARHEADATNGATLMNDPQTY